MAFTNNAVRALFLLALVCAAQAGGKKEESKKDDAGGDAKGGSCPSGTCDITKLGASGDGKTDSTKALQEAWASACGGTGKNTILIPKGDYLTGPLNYTGPCKGDVTIQVDGNLLASTDLSLYKGNWIEILRVENLVITGKGKLDGQGPSVWSKNACAKKYDCKILPNSLVLDFVTKGEVSGITLLNSLPSAPPFQAAGAEPEEDRLSALNNATLHAILGRLPLRDAVATTVLSRRWPRVFATLPRLRVECGTVNHRDYGDDDHYEDSDRWLDALDCVLDGRAAPVSVFDIRTKLMCQEEGWFADLFFEICGSGGLRELLIMNCSLIDCYQVPSSVYNCQTLTSLELYSCHLRVSGNLTGLRTVRSLLRPRRRMARHGLRHRPLAGPLQPRLRAVRGRSPAPGVQGSWKELCFGSCL